MHSKPCRGGEVDEAGKNNCSADISSLGNRLKYFETYFMLANTNVKVQVPYLTKYFQNNLCCFGKSRSASEAQVCVVFR